MPAAPPDLLGITEAADLLRVSADLLYTMALKGEVPAFRLVPRGRWRFSRRALLAWFEQRTDEQTAARRAERAAQ